MGVEVSEEVMEVDLVDQGKKISLKPVILKNLINFHFLTDFSDDKTFIANRINNLFL